MGRRRKKIKEQKEHITKDILLGLLEAGALISVAIIAPNALRIVKLFGEKKKEWDHYYPSSIHRHTVKLWRKGYVDVKESRDGFTVVITEKGKQEILKYNLDTMSIPKQDPWDGKWRMVFFDIPSGNESERSMFREKLRSMEFFKMQKSVYVHPYPCWKQIQFVREVLSIPHSVKLATVEHLENDDDLRRVFRLT